MATKEDIRYRTWDLMESLLNDEEDSGYGVSQYECDTDDAIEQLADPIREQYGIINSLDNNKEVIRKLSILMKDSSEEINHRYPNINVEKVAKEPDMIRGTIYDRFSSYLNDGLSVLDPSTKKQIAFITSMTKGVTKSLKNEGQGTQAVFSLLQAFTVILVEDKGLTRYFSASS